MGTITFDFDVWDDEKDILLHRPGNDQGYAAIQASLEVGDMVNIRARQRNDLIRTTEAGVVGLVAGGLEWLRQRGYSAEAIQSKVRAFKQANLDRLDQSTMKERQILKAIYNVSNPKSRKYSESLILY